MFQRILVPVDGSEASNEALQTAISMAAQGAGQLRLVHVLDHTTYLTGYDPLGGSSGQLFGAVRDSGLDVLQQGTSLAQARGLQVDATLVERLGSRLGDAVAEEATACGADLIVLGTHGRSGPSRLLLGSGAEQIIRLAPVPVLVVRKGAAT